MPYVKTENKTASHPTSLEAYALMYKEQLYARNYAQQSVEYKHVSLCWFIAWCHDRGLYHIEEITRPVLQRYQRHLFTAPGRGGKPLSIAGQRNRLTAVRTWFRFLMRENVILYNPASELELPKEEKRLPKDSLTPEEAEKEIVEFYETLFSSNAPTGENSHLLPAMEEGWEQIEISEETLLDTINTLKNKRAADDHGMTA